MTKYSVNLFSDLSLLNVRILFLASALIHLLITAFVTLRIDTTVDEDPRIKAYYSVRWKLLTCWFNLITLAYLPIRLYVDWRARRGEERRILLVRTLRHVSDVIMTSILFPVTLYSDFAFWYMYLKDPALMAPPNLFNYLPNWAQHSLHTVSMVVVLLDLVLTPRRRPATLKPRIALLTAFTVVYAAVLYTSYLKGEIVYSLFETMEVPQFLLLAVLSLVFMLTLFTIQWMAIGLLHGTKKKTKKIV